MCKLRAGLILANAVDMYVLNAGCRSVIQILSARITYRAHGVVEEIADGRRKRRPSLYIGVNTEDASTP